MSYKIVRSFHGPPSWKRTIRRGLTLAQARAWCGDPETCHTGTSAKARRITRRCRCPWFDTYTAER